MNDAQLRVLAIMGATAVLEAVRSQTVRDVLLHPLDANAHMAAVALTFAISVGLLIALAAAAPTVATGIAILVFLLALLTNAGLVSGLIQGAANLTQFVRQ